MKRPDIVMDPRTVYRKQERYRTSFTVLKRGGGIIAECNTLENEARAIAALPEACMALESSLITGRRLLERLHQRLNRREDGSSLQADIHMCESELQTLEDALKSLGYTFEQPAGAAGASGQAQQTGVMPVRLRLAALPPDIQDALADVGEEMLRARAKFPGTKHLTAALMEEVGEVAKELLEEGDNVWGECVQVACVALRIATEGDADYQRPRAGCAACDRGDFQLGHAEWCSKGQT